MTKLHHTLMMSLCKNLQTEHFVLRLQVYLWFLDFRFSYQALVEPVASIRPGSRNPLYLEEVWSIPFSSLGWAGGPWTETLCPIAAVLVSILACGPFQHVLPIWVSEELNNCSSSIATAPVHAYGVVVVIFCFSLVFFRRHSWPSWVWFCCRFLPVKNEFSFPMSPCAGLGGRIEIMQSIGFLSIVTFYELQVYEFD